MFLRLLENPLHVLSLLSSHLLLHALLLLVHKVHLRLIPLNHVLQATILALERFHLFNKLMQSMSDTIPTYLQLVVLLLEPLPLLQQLIELKLQQLASKGHGVSV